MIAALLIIILYGFVMLLFLFGNWKLPKFTSEAEIITETTFTIVIPFRNEAEQLKALLDSIASIDYPMHQHEVIFIDDASEDHSAAMVLEWIRKHSEEIQATMLTNVRTSASPKKDAIRLAVSKSKYTWILTTDADCVVPPTWLLCFDAFIQKYDSVFIAAPLTLVSRTKFIELFQMFDMLSLQATTMGSFGIGFPLLCNGANLGYKKAAFLAVNDFQGNDHLASGDDIFTLEKMRLNFPKKTHYLKSKGAIVQTKPVLTWRQVLTQRIRWASKTSKQKSVPTLLLGLLVFGSNLIVLILPLLMALNCIDIYFGIGMICIKFIADILMIRTAARFFGKRLHPIYFICSFYVYATITITVVLGSLFGTYSWKGRAYAR